MKQTCVNCIHHHGCLSEAEPSQYHIHDYCDVWDRTLACPMHSLVNDFLDSFFAEAEKANYEAPGIWDDFETGEAYCYRFEENDEQDSWLTDDKMEANRQFNLSIALRTIDKLLSKDSYYDQDVDRQLEIDDNLRNYLIKLKQEFLKLK